MNQANIDALIAAAVELLAAADEIDTSPWNERMQEAWTELRECARVLDPGALNREEQALSDKILQILEYGLPG